MYINTFSTVYLEIIIENIVKITDKTVKIYINTFPDLKT